MSEKNLTIADLTERMGLPAGQQTTVASWCGEDYDDLVTYGPHGPEWAPVFDEDDIARLLLAWQVGGDNASSVKYPDITVQLSGEDGNGAAIIGRVAKAIRRAHGAEAATTYMTEARASRSYDDLLTHAMRTVNVE